MFDFHGMFALLMKFYPGLNPNNIREMSWMEFVSYLEQIEPLMKMFSGIDTTSDNEVKEMFKQRGII